MPSQHAGASADEPRSGEVPEPRDSPVTPADHDPLDEDGLLEEQPYASLEAEIVTYGEVVEEDDEGPGSW